MCHSTLSPSLSSNPPLSALPQVVMLLLYLKAREEKKEEILRLVRSGMHVKWRSQAHFRLVRDEQLHQKIKFGLITMVLTNPFLDSKD